MTLNLSNKITYTPYEILMVQRKCKAEKNKLSDLLKSGTS